VIRYCSKHFENKKIDYFIPFKALARIPATNSLSFFFLSPNLRIAEAVEMVSKAQRNFMVLKRLWLWG
jgi:hypothetical protein